MRTVIILEVMDDVAATVVPLMKWTDRGKGKKPPGEPANNFFTGPSENKFLNFPRGKIVSKTELFRMPPGDIFPVKEGKMDELKKLMAAKIYLQKTQCGLGGDMPTWPDRPKLQRHASY